MPMTKLQRCRNKLNDEFRDAIIDVMRKEFGIEVENMFDFFGSGRLITTRVDGEDFTPEQHQFLRAFSEGYGQAMSKVTE